MRRSFKWFFDDGPIPYPALALLGSGWDRAVNEKQSLWAFAADRASLADMGLDDEDLRLLLAQGMILHRRGAQPPRRAKQPASPSPCTPFGPRSCFVLTVRGVRWAAQLLRQAKAKRWADAIRTAPDADELLKPCWHERSRQLYFAGLLVKQFRKKAANQIALAVAFHRARWQDVIDLPRELTGPHCPVAAVHDTLRRLHQDQVNEVLSFRQDGTGLRVLWETCIPA